MRQIMPLAVGLVLACGLRRGEGADESAPLAWPELAQSFDREARQRERAAGQFGFRRHDGLMPGDPLQAALHVQDAAPQVEVAPFEPVSFFGAESA